MMAIKSTIQEPFIHKAVNHLSMGVKDNTNTKFTEPINKMVGRKEYSMKTK